MTKTERILGLVAALIAIFAFITGIPSLQWRRTTRPAVPVQSARTLDPANANDNPSDVPPPTAAPTRVPQQRAGVPPNVGVVSRTAPPSRFPIHGSSDATPTPAAGSIVPAARSEHASNAVLPLKEIGQLRSLGYIVSITFTRSGDQIISGGGDSVVLKFWNVASKNRIISLKADIDFVNVIRSSPNGQHLALGCRDGSIRIWDAAKRRELSSIPEHGISVVDLQYNSDGRLLASGGYRRGVKEPRTEIAVWEMEAGREIARLDGAAQAFSFLPFEESLLVGDKSGQLRQWHLRTGTSQATLHVATSIASLTVSPRGTDVAVAGEDGMIRIVDLSSHKIRSLGVQPTGQFQPVSMAFDATGTFLATTSDEPHAGTRVWNIRTGLLHARSDYSADAIAFSPDGQFLATGSWDSSIRLWSYR